MSSTANKEEKKRWLQSVLICVENLLLEMKKIFPVVTEKISFVYQTDFDILDQDENEIALEDFKSQIRSLNQCLEHFSTISLKRQTVKDILGKDKDDKNSFHCKSCRLKFSDKIILDQHMNHVHRFKTEHFETASDLPFFCCSICSVSFPQELELKNHSCNSSAEYTLVIPQLQVLQKHNKFVCGYCKEELRQFSRMRFHLSVCKGGPFKCELCQSSFETRPELTCHKTTTHQNEKPFFCSECPLSFKLNTSLQKHLIQKHESIATRTSFSCDKCPKKFIKKLYLTHHKTRFHNLEKPFLCPRCGEGFLSAKSLKVNEENHLNPSRFECHLCEKKFSRKDKLESHMTTHTGLRPFRCEMCERAFGTKSKLNEHQRRHLGEKRFSCLVCHKKFSSFEKARHCFHSSLFKEGSHFTTKKAKFY